MAFPTSGLVAYYKLDESSGATRNDSVGSNHLTDHNTVGSVTGKISNAANFNGTTQYLSAADATAFQMGSGTSFTLAAWIKSTDVSDFLAIIVYGTRGDAGYGFTTTSGNVRFFVGEGFPWNQATQDLGLGTHDGAWHLVVGTCNRTAQEIKVYGDGTSVISGPTSCSAIGSVNSSVGFKIAAHASTPSGFWGGNVDEVGLWNRVLTSGEIDELWNGGAGITYSPVVNVSVDLVGVSASPAIGTGTVTIESTAVTPPPLVAGGAHTAPWDWWPKPEEEVYLGGVAASPRIGSGTVHSLPTAREFFARYPFPQVEVPREPKRIPPLVVRQPAKPPPPPMIFVHLAGPRPMPAIGTGTVRLSYELHEDEMLVFAAMMANL